MKLRLVSTIILSMFLLSCKDKKQSTPVQEPSPTFKNKGHELVSNMIEKAGSYRMLLNKKDVVYTYTYQTPDGKKDVSTEKYMFNGELSYGIYNNHERTLPELEGVIEQGYDGKGFWLKHNGVVLSDPTQLKRVAFNRPTNFYWFAMFQKLLDPGVNYEYLGEEEVNNTAYNVVKVTFQSIDDKPTDIYQLYLNKNTQLVDQFLFTVADFGVIETPFLMELQYEEVDGLLMPTKRQYKKSTWHADVSEEPWIYVTWSDIKFNNGLTKADFLQ
ncbi:DUF6503 family protein [Mariniflexile sp. AS56]|uniref:DUF6503 family protein n=1 Tax=Mariniflexile sp. AS56 TaxID=3063957 RepID=UPI0026ED1BE5|nr:DUF6503 family protein [Mariniflexile sp. AS56]MDO7171333.1 hypothetical protein [Mariniflexile sp. AS56]